MALSKFKIKKGTNLQPQASSANSEAGDLEVLSSDNKLYYHNGSTNAPVISATSADTLTNKTIDADSNTITNIDNNEIKALAAIDATKIADGSVSNTEFQYLDGATGNLQTQISAKEPTVTKGNLTEATSSVLTITGGTGAVIGTGTSIQVAQASGSTSGYLDSADFSTFNAKQPAGNYITALTGDVTATGPGSVAGTIANDAVTNDKLANMAAWTFKIRNAGTSGDPSDAASADVTEATTPATGDFIVGYLSTGEIRKYKIGNVTGGTGGIGSVNPGAAITANYNVVSGDNGRVLNIDTTSPRLVTLPAPSAGFKVTVKDYLGTANTNGITVSPNSTESIDNIAGSDAITGSYNAVSYISDGSNWFRIASFSGQAITPSVAGRGVFAGGFASSAQNTIDYVTISSVGNATDFGDLTNIAQFMAGTASSTRGLFHTGELNGSTSANVDYITIASAGNATTFGNLTQARFQASACGSSTRGLFGGGFTTGVVNTIDYVTIASAGNAIDFGDLTASRNALAGCSSTTRGLFGGGNTGSISLVIDYVTIASAGNATAFGNLTQARDSLASCSSATRGLWAGGQDGGGGTFNIIDYVTIASTGNATDFGDLSATIRRLAGCSSATRGLFAGGDPGNNVNTNVIDYVTIASTGNATDFGDLTQARRSLGACSDSHGGL